MTYTERYKERERERGGGWGLDENIKLTECEK